MATETSAKISLEAFSKLAHISKRKAKWLLENGYIPCVDTGKQTHRFVISMKDANKFLSSPAPKYPIGSFSSKAAPEQGINPIAQINPSDFKRFLILWWSCQPDALKVTEIASLTGYTCPTIRQWLNSGKIKYIATPDERFVPKHRLINFVVRYTAKYPSHLSATHKSLALAFLKGSEAIL